MKSILYLITFLTLASCVPQSDYDQLKSDYDQLRSEREQLEQKVIQLEEELSSIQYKYDELVEEKTRTEIESNKIPYISEAKAMQYIKDNYDFYEKDTKYRNVQLRRVADNSFMVSIEECSCKSTGSSDCCDDNFWWRSRVRTLTVNNNGKYDF